MVSARRSAAQCSVGTPRGAEQVRGTHTHTHTRLALARAGSRRRRDKCLTDQHTCLRPATNSPYETKLCRHNWHSAGSLGLASSNAKIQIYIFQMKYTEATVSNSTRKLLWFEITKMPIALKK